MSRRISSTFLLGALLQLGCHQLESEYQDCVAYKRDECDAMWAWHRCKGEYKGQVDFIHDFGYGFKSGYMNIAGGGNGCPPTLPPELYWDPRYQTDEGHCRVQAWFDGYTAGVLVAEGDGVGGRNKIPLSNYRYWQLTRQQQAPMPMSPADVPHYGNPVEDVVPPAPVPHGVPAVEASASDVALPPGFGLSQPE